VTVPEYRKNNGGFSDQFHEVGEWRGLHRRVRPTFPAYDVTCQLTQGHRVAELMVSRGDNGSCFRLRHGHAAFRALHYLPCSHTNPNGRQKFATHLVSFQISFNAIILQVQTINLYQLIYFLFYYFILLFFIFLFYFLFISTRLQYKRNIEARNTNVL